MEEIFRKAVAHNAAMRKTSVPWQPDTPHPQGWHEFDADRGRWVPCVAGSGGSSSNSKSREGKEEDEEEAARCSRLALHAWNIDMMIPYGAERMQAALAHLEKEVVRFPPPSTDSSSDTPAATANVIFLQECTTDDVVTVAASPWVRRHFRMTETAEVSGDGDGGDGNSSAASAASKNWGSAWYGTLTLVDRRLPVRSCFRVHYAATGMERDVLFVDVSMASSSAKGGAGEEVVVGVRLGNTHLESLALDPPLRPAQVAVAASYLPTTRTAASSSSSSATTGEYSAAGVRAGLMAGDFNAIEPFDATLHADHGLSDAYLVSSSTPGRDPAAVPRDEAATWGQQAATVLRDRFGLSRMDKIFYTDAAASGEEKEEEGKEVGVGAGGLRLVRFERFGAGVELLAPGLAEEFAALGFDRPWVTDHLGVLGVFEVVG